VYWFVAELVDRLRDVVPEGIAVAASTSGRGVEMSATAPPFVGGAICYVEDVVEQPHRTLEQNVEAAAWNVLSTLQDLIARTRPSRGRTRVAIRSRGRRPSSRRGFSTCGTGIATSLS
jgi:hypothetical protein